MDLNEAIEAIDNDTAQAELTHLETTRGPQYVLSDDAINQWMDA
jgi:hypothetical protein